MKNAIIFGDSYSTFEGYIPENYAVYYTKAGRPETDVTDVSETWWNLTAKEANLNIVLNNSWSGSTIGYTGWNNTDCSQTSSFIFRLEQLIKDGFFEKNTIDTVFVFGATNDSWCNAPLGEIKYDEHKKEDLYCVLPAICYFLKKLKETLPEAKIYCLVNTDLKPQVSDVFDKACKKFEINKIAFEYIDKKCSHPTIKGMQDIKNQILENL